MNMLPLPGTIDDFLLRRDYGSGCRVLAVPGGPKGSARLELLEMQIAWIVCIICSLVIFTVTPCMLSSYSIITPTTAHT